MNYFLIFGVFISFSCDFVFGGGGYENYYNYGYSGWRNGPGVGLGVGPHRQLGLGGYHGYRHLKGPGWRGNYRHGGYGGGYGDYGPSYGGYGRPAGSSASASASASSGGGLGPFGGGSNSQAHAETASFNLGPLSATFSKSDANANALGK